MARRAQIQFGEAIMVIVVLLMLIVIGIVFYYNYLKSSIVEERGAREDTESATLAKVVLAMGELRCASVAAGCVDLVAADAFRELAADMRAGRNPAARGQYDDLLGLADIRLHLVTGTRAGTALVLYDAAPATGEHDELRQFLFTLVRDPRTGEDCLGYLNVTLYRRVSA